jgi:hypothetical protein
VFHSPCVDFYCRNRFFAEPHAYEPKWHTEYIR